MARSFDIVRESIDPKMPPICVWNNLTITQLNVIRASQNDPTPTGCR